MRRACIWVNAYDDTSTIITDNRHGLYTIYLCIEIRNQLDRVTGLHIYAVGPRHGDQPIDAAMVAAATRNYYAMREAQGGSVLR